MTDRYLKSVLTVIAGALIYLCVILTPIPRASAQTPSIRPGEPSGPTEVVVVGWQAGAREADRLGTAIADGACGGTHAHAPS